MMVCAKRDNVSFSFLVLFLEKDLIYVCKKKL